MKLLIAEDEPSISLIYQIELEDRGHEVLITNDGDECLKVYSDALAKLTNSSKDFLKINTPFDAVILDYRMPKMDGMETAKAILELNPHQRIIFASAFVLSTLQESVKYLNKVVELIQKPFETDVLADMIEDVAVYEELKKINVNVQLLKELNPTHDQIRDLLQGLQKLQNKNRLANDNPLLKLLNE